MTPRPFTLVAELTYRCPLACPYCSNPTDFARATHELATEEWRRILREAEALGVVQVHLTGGEPLLRGDLEALVVTARSLGMYTNLVTSGVPFDRSRFERLARAGVEHVQLSFQAPEAALSDRIGGWRAFSAKLGAARAVRETGMALTLNVVLHRENIDSIGAIVRLARELGATRLELAHAQYHGFALRNRDALLPSAEAVGRARLEVERTRRKRQGSLEIVHVLPDLHAGRPKACMDGWARRYLHVTPDGFALPCHAARGLASLAPQNVRDHALSSIWSDSPLFNAFRGEAWMKEPCRSCERRHTDFGGCRCQAFALTGDAAATDPACELSPHHELVLAARRTADRAVAARDGHRYLYRAPRSAVPAPTKVSPS